MHLPALEPGSWADWANAVATTLGFTVALVLFVIGLRDRRRADEDRRHADLDRRSRQARKVWVWRAGWSGPEKQAGWTPQQHHVCKVGWRIENTSEDPITACWIYLQDRNVIYRGKDFPPMMKAAEVVRAGETVHGELDCDVIFELYTFEREDATPHLSLLFTDAAGVRWERLSDGELKERKR